MDHRRTPARKALTLPGWIIILSALLCLAAGALYVGLAVDDSRSSAEAPAAKTTTLAPETSAPSPSPSPSVSPTPSEPAEPEPSEPAVIRDLAVDVYNNTSTTGLAGSVAAKVEAAGWQVETISNWRGVIVSTTVYYPPGFEDQAETLAADLDVGRLRAAVAPMSMERLTLILSGQQ